ncbi:MAG TPA: discoidin domain-containing protein [Acidobacteriaceae bacterium]|nr:discoidin domain-containing protein [Acidobacteriaceae bacterium]
MRTSYETEAPVSSILPLRRAVALRLTALCAFAALTGVALQAFALPIPPPSKQGVRYYGYFADLRYDDAAATADQANIVCYGDFGNEEVGTRSVSELKALVANPKTKTMGVVLSVANEFFVFDQGGIPSPRATADWQSRWATYKKMIAPYMNNIVSFYLFDEPSVGDVTLMNFLGVVASRIQSDFANTYPNIHRQITFTAQGLDSSTVTIPNGVDLVGYDCYPGTFQECYAKEIYDPKDPANWRSVPYYYAMLRAAVARSNLPYHMNLAVIPEAMEMASGPDTSVSAQAAILARAEREVALAENDPDVVMVMPFLWDTIPSEGLVGTADLPMVKTYYTALGQHFLNGSARLAYPTSVFASASYSAATGPSYAFDYSTSTMWSSGGYPIGDISAVFADPIVATQMNFVVAQSPAGFTRHVLSGANAGTSAGPIATFSGSTSDNQTITWTGSRPLNYVDLQTQASPSWVAWKDVSIFASGSTRIYPSPSSLASDASLAFLVDGDLATAWSSGGYAPASVDLDLHAPQTLSRVELVVEQTPAGYTHHVVYGGPTLGSLSVLGSFDGNTQSGQALVLSGTFTNVRYVRIQTTASPSWVAWREVNLFR